MELKSLKFLFVILLGIHLNACNMPDCSGTSVHAEYIRSLSQSDFQKVHEATVKLYEGRERFDYHGKLPEEISRHGVIFIRVIQASSGEMYLRLEGCMDRHVDIAVTETEEVSKVELKYGRNTRELMWEKK